MAFKKKKKESPIEEVKDEVKVEEPVVEATEEADEDFIQAVGDTDEFIEEEEAE